MSSEKRATPKEIIQKCKAEDERPKREDVLKNQNKDKDGEEEKAITTYCPRRYILKDIV